MLAATAAAIFWVHVAIIAFNLFGLVAIPIGAWRAWPFVYAFWWRAIHLVSLLTVAMQAVLGRACFLTIWQSDIAAGPGPAEHVPLIQGWISRLIYWPLPLWAFAVIYVAVGAYTVLLWYWVRPRWPHFGRPGR